MAITWNKNKYGSQPQGWTKMSDDEKLEAIYNAGTSKSSSNLSKSSQNLNANLSQTTNLLDSSLDKYKDLVTLSEEQEGYQNNINALQLIAQEALEREAKIRKTIVQDLGQVGQLQVMQNETIQQASIEAQRYGIELEDVLRTVSDLSSALGRNVLISDEDISRLAIFQESVGLGTGAAADMMKFFDQMGFSIGEAIDKGNEMATVARQMGVNVKDFMGTVSDNMKMMNMYNFADGVKGFAKMAAQAQKLGISMSTTAAIAEKVMDPEGAIELAANLQVVGGAVGDLADPFKLMYQATNDLGGLQESLVQAGQDLAMFNEETGEISFPPTAQRQLRAMASALDMNKEEFAEMIKLQAKFKNMQNQFSFELEGREDMQEFVTSMASLNQQTGKYEIKVPGLDKAVEIEDLTAKQLDALKEVQDQQQMTEKELMAEQTSILKSINNNIKAADAAILGGVAEGLNASELVTTLSQSISDAFSSNELGNLSDAIAGFAETGVENIFGEDIEGITTGIKEGVDVLQALIGTGGGGLSDLINKMTAASEKDFQVQVGHFNANEFVVKGEKKNDFQLDAGQTQAVLKTDGEFIIPSVNDTVSGVDLTAGAKGANLGSLVSNTMEVPQKTVKVEFTGLPSRIPIELNGINMGDFNWRGLVGNNLFMQNLKSTLEETNLTTAPGPQNTQQFVGSGYRGETGKI